MENQILFPFLGFKLISSMVITVISEILSVTSQTNSFGACREKTVSEGITQKTMRNNSVYVWEREKEAGLCIEANNPLIISLF